MNITIRGDKVKVTKAIDDYVGEKLQKLDKYFDNPNEVRATVVFKIRKQDQKVEVTIPLKNLILRAEEVGEDVYSAVDVIVDKIERQIRKNKTKIQAQVKRNKGSKEIVLDSIEDSEDHEEPSVVRRKKIEVKPMSEEEAVLQMELIGHQFYLFKDSETMKPTLVYKRKDGQYGVIESE